MVVLPTRDHTVKRHGGRGRWQALALCRVFADVVGMPKAAPPLVTPDGRYLVVRGRLWRGAATTRRGRARPARPR